MPGNGKVNRDRPDGGRGKVGSDEAYGEQSRLSALPGDARLDEERRDSRAVGIRRPGRRDRFSLPERSRGISPTRERRSCSLERKQRSLCDGALPLADQRST